MSAHDVTPGSPQDALLDAIAPSLSPWARAFIERAARGGTVATRSPSGRCLILSERAGVPVEAVAVTLDEMLDLHRHEAALALLSPGEPRESETLYSPPPFAGLRRPLAERVRGGGA